MRVFILGTGRCGTLTWTQACRHIRNYTAGHETRVKAIVWRFGYPDRHIEADHRLSFFLGTLDACFNHQETVYVHLRRDPEDVAVSWLRRFSVEGGMMGAFGAGIIAHRTVPPDRRLDIAERYIETVDDNIRMFLRGKPLTLQAWVEDPHGPFDKLWEMIGAEGDRDAAHAELDVRHHPT